MQNEVSRILLDLKAVNLSPNDFFTWTSGIKSPIYCDNRVIISDVKSRRSIINKFVDLIKKDYSEVQYIAGTATAGIPWASWISESLDLPMIYIRSSAKGHGKKNSIEGRLEKGANVLIIEDLISTGKSAIKAANDVKDFGSNVLSILSIFSYDLKIASDNFFKNDLLYNSLLTLPHLLGYSKENNLLTDQEIEIINKWNQQVELI